MTYDGFAQWHYVSFTGLSSQRSPAAERESIKRD